jgi:hypothetical protein
VHNVATRWFSNYAMTERAVLLRPVLNRLFVDVEIGWFRRGSVAHKWPKIMAYKLTDSEWQIVNILLLILQRFATAIDELQGNPSTDRPTTGRFEEYLSIVEDLLDHLECALKGEILNPALEPTDKYIDIFKGLPPPPQSGNTHYQFLIESY